MPPVSPVLAGGILFGVCCGLAVGASRSLVWLRRRRSTRVDRASRLIFAPRERIYQAFVDGNAIAKWLAPAGANAVVEECDPTPGGSFCMTLFFTRNDRTKRKTSEISDTVDGRFLTLAPPSLIEQEFDFVSDDPMFAGTMKMTWTFTEVLQGTMVEVAAANVPGGIHPEEHQAGMSSSLKNLAGYVEALESRPG